MSPVAPMPWGAAVGWKGLKSCVIEFSGELSITRVFVEPLLVPELDVVLEPDDELLDEQAPSPAASRPAAATARTRLPVADLLVNIDFPL